MVSIRNTVMVAIMQVGVIVAGVLAAGICHRASVSDGVAIPFTVSMLYSYGFIGLLIPLAWATAAVTVQLRAEFSENIKTLSFWLGILMLIALAAFVIFADVPAMLAALFHMTGGGAANPGDLEN